MFVQNLSNNEQVIIKQIDQFLKEEKYIYFIPIFIIKKSNKVPSGIYCIDFNSKCLYKYKELDGKILSEEMLDKDFNICICYFVDLNKSVFIAGEDGFVRGVIQIGRLYEKIDNIAKENNFEVCSTFVPQQSFTHAIGINCRRQLFVTNQFIKET